MNMVSKVTTGKVLLRFMLYTDAHRRRATQVGTDTWVDSETVYGGQYGYGTEHELRFEEFDNQPARYVVAMLPHLKQITHPDQEGRTIAQQTVYLTTEVLWPFFEPIPEED